MVTTWRHVAASSDDADETSAGVVSIANANATSDHVDEWLAWRFLNIPIEPGSTITNARLWVCPGANTLDEPDHPFFAEDADNAATFAATANNISGRPRTTATVTWSSADLGATGSSFHESPDLSALVQEVVDRGGWADGNALVLMCRGSADANRDLNVRMFDDGANGLFPYLKLEWTPPAGKTGVSVAVGASADDARESGGTMTLATATIEADATTEYLGFRFLNVTIPQGATISAAWLTLRVVASNGDDPDHTIYGIDADNTGAFTTGASDISSRPATTATVNWASADLGQGLGDTKRFSTALITSVVQEIVDRGGWASGNAMGLVIRGSADANRDLVVYTYDSSPAVAATLEVIYEAGGIEIDLSPVEVEVELLAWDVDIDPAPINIALSPVEIEVELPAWTVTGTGIDITLSPVEVEVDLPAWTVDIAPEAIEIALSPVEVEVSLPDWIVRIAPGFDAEIPTGERRGFVDVFRVDGTLVAPLVPVLSFETKRGVNRVGSWSLTLPVDSPLVSSTPLSRAIQRGWRINLSQEGTHPYDRADLDYLCYQGMVEDKSYQLDNSGTAVCALSGSFRAIDLAAKVTPIAASYTSQEMGAVVADIEGGLVGGITVPVNHTRRISQQFNNPEGDGITSLLSRLLKIGEMARWFLRETWDEDKLEFIPIDAAPNSGYTMLRQETAGYGRSPGVAIIGGTPSLRREGRGIANRIIPIGSDTISEVDDVAESAMYLAEHRFGVEPLDPPNLTLGTQPPEGTTLIVSGKKYTFTATPTGSGDVAIGANVAATQDAIKKAFAGTDGLNSPHRTARLGSFTGDTARITITAMPAGSTPAIGGTFGDTAGNSSDPGDMGAATRTRTAPLTLQHATKSFPYVVKSASNVSGDPDVPPTGSLLDGIDRLDGSDPYGGSWNGYSHPDSDFGWQLVEGSLNDQWIAPDGSVWDHIWDQAAYHGWLVRAVGGVGGGNGNVYYIEDEESIATYGLVELVIHRSDIKNPSDDPGTRAAAANVLYHVAWGELLKNKSPKVFVDVPIANGYDVWALPGDRIRLQFSGYVIVNAEVEIWEDIDDWFLVIERVDRSTPSGAREVSFTLAAPEITIDIPGLPEALGLADEQEPTEPGEEPGEEPGGGDDYESYETYDIHGDDYFGFPAGNVSLPIGSPDPFDTIPPSLDWVPPGFTGNGGGALFPNCCDDRTTTTTSISEPSSTSPSPTPSKSYSFKTEVDGNGGGPINESYSGPGGTETAMPIPAVYDDLVEGIAEEDRVGIMFVAMLNKGYPVDPWDDVVADPICATPTLAGFDDIISFAFNDQVGKNYIVRTPNFYSSDDTRMSLFATPLDSGAAAGPLGVGWGELPPGSTDQTAFLVATPIFGANLAWELISAAGYGGGEHMLSSDPDAVKTVVFSSNTISIPGFVQKWVRGGGLPGRGDFQQLHCWMKEGEGAGDAFTVNVTNPADEELVSSTAIAVFAITETA